MRTEALRWRGLDTRRTHAPVARIAESPENLERNHRLRSLRSRHLRHPHPLTTDDGEAVARRCARC